MKRKKISFQNKIIFIFIVTILLLLSTSTIVLYIYSSRNMKEKIQDYLQNLSSVTMSKVAMSVQSVEDISFYIAGNERIQAILSNDFDQTDRQTNYRLYEEGKELLSHYVLLSHEISGIYIRDVNGWSFSYTKKYQPQPSEELFDMSETWKCQNGHIYLKRNLYRFSDQAFLGCMLTELEAPVFYNFIKDIPNMGGSKACIIDEDDTIIAGWDTSMTGESIQQMLNCSGISFTPGFYQKNLSDAEGVSIIYVGNEIYNGWRLVLTLPESYYLRSVRKLQYFTITFSAIVGAISICLIVIVGKSLTRPLKNLTKAMENVGKGNFDVSINVEAEDEIGLLGRTFNQMVKDMRRLIDNVYEQQRMRQEAEMKSLQMQINPHFLYNTLDTINWMGRMKGVDEVGEMTSALGNLMRYSLNRKDFVTIGEELKNLQDYIGIQNVRYGDRMTIRFNIQNGVQSCYIPKLLIQPILENAIVHGVEDKLEPGNIEIRIYYEGDDLYVVVEDDGVGMTQEAIEILISEDLSPKYGHTSIGVNNVNRRIQSVFGRDYGLMIQSQLGAGTTITLHMKVLEIMPDIQLKYD